MEIIEGVQLHLIKNNTLKTNHITFRFSGEFSHQTVARRVLVAQMLATANATYPTAQKFRQKLAYLYGASLSTKVSTKGLVHIIDINVTFIKNQFTPNSENLLEDIIQFLEEILFAPLVSVAQYQTKVFDVELENLVQYLEADKDDSFYYSELMLKKLFFDDETLQISKFGNVELVKTENSYTAYQEFQKMLHEDLLDIFVVGEFDEYRMLQLFNQFSLDARQKLLVFDYEQPYHNIIQEKLECKAVSQSLLQLGYHFPTTAKDASYAALLVLNGLLGAYSHSLLFTNVREKAGLAYTVNSRFDPFTGFLNIYAGIDVNNRNQALQLIIRQVADIKSGRFSSHLLKQTKQMVKNSIALSLDNVSTIIEQSYNQTHLEGYLTAEQLLDKIDNASKADIMNFAKMLRLQALYFLESE